MVTVMTLAARVARAVNSDLAAVRSARNTNAIELALIAVSGGEANEAPVVSVWHLSTAWTVVVTSTPFFFFRPLDPPAGARRGA